MMKRVFLLIISVATLACIEPVQAQMVKISDNIRFNNLPLYKVRRFLAVDALGNVGYTTSALADIPNDHAGTNIPTAPLGMRTFSSLVFSNLPVNDNSRKLITVDANGFLGYNEIYYLPPTSYSLPTTATIGLKTDNRVQIQNLPLISNPAYILAIGSDNAVVKHRLLDINEVTTRPTVDNVTASWNSSAVGHPLGKALTGTVDAGIFKSLTIKVYDRNNSLVLTRNIPFTVSLGTIQGTMKRWFIPNTELNSNWRVGDYNVVVIGLTPEGHEITDATQNELAVRYDRSQITFRILTTSGGLKVLKYEVPALVSVRYIRCDNVLMTLNGNFPEGDAVLTPDGSVGDINNNQNRYIDIPVNYVNKVKTVDCSAATCGTPPYYRDIDESYKLQHLVKIIERCHGSIGGDWVPEQIKKIVTTYENWTLWSENTGTVLCDTGGDVVDACYIPGATIRVGPVYTKSIASVLE